MTVEEWLNRQCWTKADKGRFPRWSRAYLGTSPSCISMLYALWYCKAELVDSANTTDKELSRNLSQVVRAVADKSKSISAKRSCTWMSRLSATRYGDENNDVEVITG